MLWYKGWRETRIKLLAALAMVLFFLNTVRISPRGGDHGVTIHSLLMMNTIAAGIACVWLAGAGIVTQPEFQAIKGIHGSTLFTLSLPVSRLRLLAVRASLGWLLLAGVVAFICCATRLMLPSLRPAEVPSEIVEYGLTLLTCISAFYFLCVLLATFLDEMWRVFGGMFILFCLRWTSKHMTLPGFTDIYRAMGDRSPLLTHGLPWDTIGFSACLCVFLFVGALKIAQIREY